MEGFFEWAFAQKGYDITQLAALLGYSERHLYRIKNGEIDNLENFKAKAVYRFGEDVRSFFASDVTSELHDNNLSITRAQDA